MNRHEFLKQYAWAQAQRVPLENPNVQRRDAYGSLILYSAYGDRASEYGWEIDHRIPISAFGIDDSQKPSLWEATNVQALHWRNNVRKSDSVPTRPFRSPGREGPIPVLDKLFKEISG